MDGLAQACAEAYAIHQKTDYKADFGWIDQIRHIRDQALIEKLAAKLVEAMAKAVDDGATEGIHLAFPVIYDPEKSSLIRYKGFRSWQLYADLDLPGYLNALEEREKAGYNRGRDAGYPAPPAQIRTCPLRHPAPPLGWTDGESAVRPRVSDFQPGPMGSGQSRDVSPCGAVLLRPAA